MNELKRILKQYFASYEYLAEHKAHGPLTVTTDQLAEALVAAAAEAIEPPEALDAPYEAPAAAAVVAKRKRAPKAEVAA